jgi:peroxiredoxin
MTSNDNYSNEFSVVVGQNAPDFTAEDLQGNQIQLSNFKGRKFVLLEFGSITWPPFRGRTLGMEALYKKFHAKDVEFFLIYTQEAHPGLFGYFKSISFSDKVSNARAAKRVLKMNIPILVDDMTEEIHRGYGGLPNMTYIIGKDGKIAYKELWTDPEKLELILQDLTK